MLITTFSSRIQKTSFLSKKEKEAYQKQNEQIVISQIYPAYEDTISRLSKLKTTGVYSGGLCQYPDGLQYYEKLITTQTGSNWSLAKMKEETDRSIQEAFDDLYTIYKENPSLYSAYFNCTTSTEKSPDAILSMLKQTTEQSYPIPPDSSCEIKYVEPALQSYLSPAFYMIPPIDDYHTNIIYINPAKTTNQLTSTLAHEGFPGHLYQTTYFQSKNPHPIRSLLSFAGYQEGWATYAETNSYSQIPHSSKEDATKAAIEKNLNLISLAVSCKVDLMVNSENWSVDQVSTLLTDHGLSKEAALPLYQHVTGEPGNYVKYYIGYLEFHTLRKKAERKLGNQFEEKAFHEVILSSGPCPFSMLEQSVDSYIQTTLQTKH